MLKFTLKYILLLTLLLVINLGLNAQDENQPELIKKTSLLNQPYSSVLYKAGVEAYGKYFSGIYLFKQFPKDTSYRIVMLSEFGLSYFDFKYKNEVFSVESCQEFLNKPLLLKMMQKDLKLLLAQIEIPDKAKEISKKDFDGSVYKFKYKSDKYYYFYGLKGKLEKITIREGLFKKANINISGYKEGIPEKISIDRNRQKLKISLTLLKIEP